MGGLSVILLPLSEQGDRYGSDRRYRRGCRWALSAWIRLQQRQGGAIAKTEGEGLQHQPGPFGIEAALGVVQLRHQLPQLLQLGKGEPGQGLLDELLAALPDA